MVIIYCLSWWYSRGWRWAWQHFVNRRVNDYIEYFSIQQLVRTWFSPFKQTYNDASKASIDLKVQAFFDNLVSRFIGTLARTILIITGLLAIGIVCITGIVIVIIWPFVPLTPIVGLIMSISGITL